MGVSNGLKRLQGMPQDHDHLRVRKGPHQGGQLTHVLIDFKQEMHLTSQQCSTSMQIEMGETLEKGRANELRQQIENPSGATPYGASQKNAVHNGFMIFALAIADPCEQQQFLACSHDGFDEIHYQ